jgi:hypothetical protein
MIDATLTLDAVRPSAPRHPATWGTLTVSGGPGDPEVMLLLTCSAAREPGGLVASLSPAQAVLAAGALMAAAQEALQAEARRKGV